MVANLEKIKSSFVTWIIPIIGVALWTGLVAIMDDRHEPKGQSTIAVTESDLREVRREIRNIENQLQIAPDAMYAPAREAELRELQDEEKNLMETLQNIRAK